MKRLSRLFRHLFTTSAAGRRAFPSPTLDAIRKAIAAGEKRHRAEIRLIVEPALSAGAVLGSMSARDRARELFSLYRIWDTEENLGVLVYINLADRKVEIVTDRGAGRAVKREEWQAVCRTMTEGFRHQDFHDSVLKAIGMMHDLLAPQLPPDGGNPNELPNKPLMI